MNLVFMYCYFSLNLLLFWANIDETWVNLLHFITSLIMEPALFVIDWSIRQVLGLDLFLWFAERYACDYVLLFYYHLQIQPNFSVSSCFSQASITTVLKISYNPIIDLKSISLNCWNFLSPLYIWFWLGQSLCVFQFANFVLYYYYFPILNSAIQVGNYAGPVRCVEWRLFQQ